MGTGATDWSAVVLVEIASRVRTSTVTEARSVEVREAWADGPLSVCLIYRLQRGPWIGLRRHADDARRAILQPDEAWPAVMVAAYDMGDERVVAGALPDPERFAWNVVDFELGDPVEPDDDWPRDSNGIAWHGHLDAAAPPHRPM